MEQENWIECFEFTNYEVSNLGRIRTAYGEYKGNIIIPHNSGNGYLGVTLNGKAIRVHQLILKSFLPNLSDSLIVNHKDGNKNNNKLDNLEWVTYSENLKHAYTFKLREQNKDGSQMSCKKVLQYTFSGEFVKEYSGVRVAERETGIKAISMCISKRKGRAGGYLWKFIE